MIAYFVLICRPAANSSLHKADKFLQAFLPFTVEHTPANPLHLAPLHQICALQSGGISPPKLYHQMSKVITAYHEYLWHSTATSQVDRWLTWQPHTETDEKAAVNLPSAKHQLAQVRSIQARAKLWPNINFKALILLDVIYVSQHIEKDKLSLEVKIDFWYFLYGCSFISNLMQKLLTLDIAFLRYGNFIEDVITNW